jgi:hypothetical protein
LQAGFYLSSVGINGREILENEAQVEQYLLAVLRDAGAYTVKAYERTGVSFQIKRTAVYTHAFYVIAADGTEYHTLSFYGTKIAFYSEGAWILDADSDMASYKSFIEGANTWDVAEIVIGRGIDAEQTAANILAKIGSDVAYYYKDHINNKAGRDNCNTALWETLAEKEP